MNSASYCVCPGWLHHSYCRARRYSAASAHMCNRSNRLWAVKRCLLFLLTAEEIFDSMRACRHDTGEVVSLASASACALRNELPVSYSTFYQALLFHLFCALGLPLEPVVKPIAATAQLAVSITCWSLKFRQTRAQATLKRYWRFIPQAIRARRCEYFR